MAAPSLDLKNLLSSQYRDKTIDTLLDNLFNRHLSKSDTVPMYGYVGDQQLLQPGEVQITEATLERQINQLTPFIYSTHASETVITSWADLVQLLSTLGVDYTALQSWFSSVSYNFVPPIDLDKFCNYQEYYWVGGWLLKNPANIYGPIGLPNVATYVVPAFSRWGNTTISQEYYVIQRPPITTAGVPISPLPTFPVNVWSDWSYSNLWVHRSDLDDFLATNVGGTIGFGDIVQATRPIIEYSCYVGLNTAQDANGVPIDSGTRTMPVKTRVNQLPLFDLYHYNGSHIGATSAIFYYKEGQQYAIDPVIGRRLASDANYDLIFEHALVSSADSSLYFYKLYDPVSGGVPVTTSSQKTIWRSGPVATPQYVRYDTAGTLINRDAFVNYKNYFWTGVDGVAPTYNPTGLPEYYVIGIGGTSDWSTYNRWVHVSQLKRADLPKYVQAVRPIIEFNPVLESQLINTKTTKDQLPVFKHYISTSSHTYEQVPGSFDPNNNDAYLTGHLFARVADLTPAAQAVITTNANIFNTCCFTYNDETYMQDLFTGAYYDTSATGTYFGYKTSTTFIGTGSGSLTTISQTLVVAGSFTIGQPYQINFIGTTDFTLIGASSNTIGLTFVATGPGAGTGSAVVQVIGDDQVHGTFDAGTFIIGLTYKIATIGTTDFTLIGATVNEVGTSFVATGRGSGTGTAIIQAFTELVTFTYVASAGNFAVAGSVTGPHAPATIGINYVIDGVIVQVAEIVPFIDGDQFVLEILSYAFEPAQLYVNMNGAYRTLSSATEIYNEAQNINIIPADTTLQNGIWTPPPQLQWNVVNETRADINEGDLYYHLTSIIKAQPGLTGAALGNNNWRNLTVDVGLGGVIKQYDGDTALLISHLLQQGLSTNTLLEFARASYQALSTSIKTFVQDELPGLLTAGTMKLPLSGDDIDPAIVNAFKTYFFEQSPVIIATGNTVEEEISTPFYDSTSSLFNLVATLPYLGLATPVQPQKYFDQDLNLNMLRHHDGHATQLYDYPVELAKKIILLKFVRSPGQETAGIISGFDYPQKPYAGQYWFKTGTGQLFIYNALSDDGTLPATAEAGAYAYNRVTDDVWTFDGRAWHHLGSGPGVTSIPWTEVMLDLILQNLELAIEAELYVKCPLLTSRLNVVSLQSDPHYEPLMASTLEAFGVKYGAVDVYASAFDQNNAFTWNYTSVQAPDAIASHATWQDIYVDVYGTSRPDLQPWILGLYVSEAAFLSDMIAHSLLPAGTSAWSASMWTSGIATYITNKREANIPPKVGRLSVDPTLTSPDGIVVSYLIPPYFPTSTQSLLAGPPDSAMNSFVFGDNGPVERYWRQTLDFLYSQQKTYYKIDPLTYTRETWGVKHQQVGEYTLNPLLGRKEGPSDFVLHGTALTELAQPSWLTVTSTANPAYVYSYTFVCVSRLDGIFSLVVSNDAAAEDLTTGVPALPAPPLASAPLFLTLNAGADLNGTYTALSYVDKYLTVSLTPSPRGFFYGDTFVILHNADGTFTTSITPQLYYKAEGLNQLYVEYGRIYGGDTQIAINTTLLQKWEMKLGYRTAAMINTDELSVIVNGANVENTAYSVILKENKFYRSSWIDTLRVQLVNRGSTSYVNGYNVPAIGPGGTPGEDWVFRVDNYNVARTMITWFNYDLAGEYSNFIALDGSQTSAYAWKRYLTTTSTQSYSVPFLVTGIQNFLNFIFGYSDYLENIGWQFNDPNDPIMDASLARPIGYQLLIEKFIVQQFLSVDAGSYFIFNPFQSKVWYNVAHGALSGVNNVLGLEFETVPTILDVNQAKLPKNSIRVFRQGTLNELVFDVPVYTLHVLTSEYEHVLVFENYSISTLLYDGFLGQHVSRIFLEGKKQANFTGNIDFGGHFLLSDQMKQNLETSVSSIIHLYDTNTFDVNPEALRRAQALFGYQKKSYFGNRGTTDASQFRFWQGMIGNKGTNFSIDAFTNSASYSSSSIDEYWAYKIAEYGDARAISKSELKVQPEDCTGEYANYVFIEADDFLPGTTGVDPASLYDNVPFDYHGYETTTTTNYAGEVIVQPGDAARWYSYSDLNTVTYLEAGEITRMVLTPTATNNCYVVADTNGAPVRADFFEIILPAGSVNAGSFIIGVHYVIGSLGTTDFTLIGASANTVGTAFVATGPGTGNGIAIVEDQTFYEAGDYIPGSADPAMYTPPKFSRLNHSTIKILSSLFVNVVIIVVAYGPAASQYSPNLLYDYINDTLIKDDIIWWDPGRNVHHPQAAASITYDGVVDPAVYTNSIFTYKNSSLVKNKPWGSAQVGKVWWNTNNLYWQGYSDEVKNPTIFDRLSQWGAISDMSSIEVYEWTKSSTLPSAAATGQSMAGEPAIMYYAKSNRTWWQRPIAWRYSSNPALVALSFLAYQPALLQVTVVNDAGQAVLKTGSFDELGLTIGTKISAARYTSSLKTDVYLKEIFGLATITSSSTIVVGSSAGFADNPTFVSGSSGTYNVELDVNTILFTTSYLGEYTFTSLTVSGSPNVYYAVLTQVATGKTQQILLSTSLNSIGQSITYNFDTFGVKLVFLLNVNQPTDAVQASAITAANVSFYLRSAVSIFSPIPFVENGVTYVELTDPIDPYYGNDTLGWITWNDPTSNPNVNAAPPLNQWQPYAGSWSQVGSYLLDVSSDIKARIADPWTWFDGSDYTPYKSSWSPWNRLTPTIIEARYLLLATDTKVEFNQLFTFVGFASTDVLSRGSVYVNEKRLSSTNWSVQLNGSDPMVVISSPLLQGDVVRVKVNPYVPTAADLAFNPSVSDIDPLLLVKYQLDYPYVTEILRDDYDNLTVTNYYYWVKNKTTKGATNQLPISAISNLLIEHDGLYGVPQNTKAYNQLDGRPNRYSNLSIRNLGLYVRGENQFKLRLTKDPTLRDRDDNLNLKPAFQEWTLLRPGQLNLIPIELWNTLTDTLAGSTSIGQQLPSTVLSLYDRQHGTSASYGVDVGQVMTGVADAAATVKYTILNTKVVIYVNGVATPDYISYSGFDITQLDVYLAPANVRKFMTDLWRNAKTSQVNEIFFVVLQDLAANQLELDMLFKTSLISLNDVKTTTISG